MDGTLKAALVEGEPGIGKSRLVAEAVGHASGPYRLVTGDGHEMEREGPLGVIADALRLDDVATDPGGDGDPRAAVVELLGSNAAGRSGGGIADMRFRFCGRGLCEEHAKMGPFLLATSHSESRGRSEGIVVEDALQCGSAGPGSNRSRCPSSIDGFAVLMRAGQWIRLAGGTAAPPVPGMSIV